MQILSIYILTQPSTISRVEHLNAVVFMYQKPLLFKKLIGKKINTFSLISEARARFSCDSVVT